MKRWVRAFTVAILCSIVSFFIYKTGVLNYLENKAYDKRMSITAKYFKASDDIILIYVDQESLDRAREERGWAWPWPREAYGDIVNFISAGKGKAIMFDMFYTEPSVYGEEDDFAFAQAQWDYGKVCHPIFLQDDGRVLLPIKPIKETAAELATIRSNLDKDDVIRRYSPFSVINGVKYPSLGMVPLQLEGEKFQFPTLEDDGTYRLRFLKSVEEYHPYKAYDVLESYEAWKNGEEGVLVPEDFEGTYTYFGLYAPGLFDICSTPVSQVYPGVGVHITALDNYLQNNFIKTVPELTVFLFILMAAILGSMTIVMAEHQKKQGKIILVMNICLAIGFIFIFLIPIFLFRFNLFVPQIPLFLNFVLSFGINFDLIYLKEGKQKRFIKSAFSQCLSKDVVNEIINNPSSFSLGGKKIDMTAIFTDIEKFSSFSELLSASQLGTLLNYYLTKMSDIIINERGTIDKYEGDAIVAMVGAPVQMDDHAIRACSAAIKMKKEEVAMNGEIAAVVAKGAAGSGISAELFEAFKIMVENNKRIYTRIGINSGEMIAGYFGSTLKKNYTIMGNNVNLAARLEGVNKQYCTGGILISEFTQNQLGNKFLVRRLDRVQVVNVNTPLRLYELLEDNDFVQPEDIAYVNKWEIAMDYFEKGQYEKSLQLFKDMFEEKPSDKVAAYYISLIENFFIQGKYPTDRDDVGVAYNPELKVFKLLQK